MTSDLATVLTLLGAAIVMFMLNRPRMDAVALLMIIALPLTGIISLDEALVGLSDPNIVLIAALFVIGEGLVRTGVAQRMGDWLAASAGKSEARLIVSLMIIVAGVGSVMSSTGVVAIFIPIVLRIARRTGFGVSRLMMPLSVAALISGMMTLVATAPNLVVHGELVRREYDGFGFFSFTLFGLPVLAVAILYMLVARRFLVSREPVSASPSRPRLSNWIEDYALAGRDHRLRVSSTSPMIGKALTEMDLRASAGINILAIERPARFSRQVLRPVAQTRIVAGDVLLLDLFNPSLDMDALATRYGLEHLTLSEGYYTDHTQEIGMAELMVPATSDLIGRTVVEASFRSTYDLVVIGLKRGLSPITGSIAAEPLRMGDTLLVIGPWRAISRLQGDIANLIVLSLPRESEEVLPASGKATHAIFSLAVMVVLMVSGLVPNLLAALIAGLLMGLFGCIDFRSAYRSIHWQSLVLIIGMLPFSIALQRTGGVDIAARAVLEFSGNAGPHLILASIFLATAILGMFISNTATAVLMAPVALAVATALDASPYPFAMTVALAASAAFMTPVSSPVNTLVVGPGQYSFWDFLRVGTPLALLTLLVCVVLVPVVMPF